jgi:hypothetical protein
LVDLSELTQLKEEVAALKTEVECLKRAKDDPTFKTTQPDADPSLADVVKITQDMFGTPEVTVEHDPEDPEVQFVVFTVFPSGFPAGLVQKRVDWHERVNAIPPRHSGAYRLSIVPKE